MGDFLILHGWGSSAKKWSRVKVLLEAAGLRVLTIDLPGFGGNEALTRPWSLDDYADWLWQYIQKAQKDLQLSESFFLLGHSFGGAVAVKFALKHPKSVKKLFLVSAALVRKRTFRKVFMKNVAKLFFFLPRSIKEVIYRRIIKSDYPLKPGPLKETYLKIIKEDLTFLLDKINVPTAIIWGRRDRVTFLKDAYLINEKIPGSELRVVEKAGHRINLEAPEKLSQEILSLLP